MNDEFRALEINMADNVDHQIEHCFRSYEGELLMVKLRELVGEWMWKGFNAGFGEARERADEFVQSKKTLADLHNEE